MKFRNIFVAGLSVAVLASCSDYLDVEAPSKNDLDYVFSDEKEINRALNGIYASMLTNDTYGQKFYESMIPNNDVEFKTSSSQYSGSNNSFRYDSDADGGDALKAWKALYVGIERANIFVDQLPQSDLWNADEPDPELSQQLGEAKVLRAVFYHDLTWFFGDVPFSFNPSYKGEKIFPIVPRTQMLQTLIDDLKSAAPGMKFASDLSEGVERVSKEMCWAMIMRLALTAGGYSLYPDGNTYGKMARPDNYLDFYKTAVAYGDSIISSGTHNLALPYYKVFVNQCNHSSQMVTGDDVIFEIPFGKESTGTIGYIHGPKMDESSGETLHPYGKASSSAKLNALYRFSFNENDVRRNYINQLFYYTNQNVATLDNGLTTQNGKWSKLWVNGGLGASSSSKGTGINFPMMRYTDVLLMFAEAVNVAEQGLGGEHGEMAKAAFAKVRNRAFPNNPELVDAYVAEKAASPELFHKAVLDERKWEFAGEGLRYRDLVRNNLLADAVYWTYFRYFFVAYNSSQYDADIEYVSLHDFGKEKGYDDLPYAMYHKNDVDNVDADGNKYYTEAEFPNQSVKVVRIANPYKKIPATEGTALNITKADCFNWYSEDLSGPRQDFLYSMLGYIYCDENSMGDHKIMENGTYKPAPDPASVLAGAPLPPVRYILPIPRQVLAHSNGQYTNQYMYK